MLVLGIESSCDETAASVIEGGRVIRSNVIASQIATHAPFGGVVPELASREHLDQIAPVVKRALAEASVTIPQIDGIAVTQGPGLIGSLLVGISFAKSLAMTARKPIVGVNHIEGHIYSVVFENPPVEYPALALIVSGGHTTLFLILEEGRYAVLGRTRDDAAGEAYDKVAKLLGLGYPGGPVIDRLAKLGNPRAADLVFTLPRMDSPHLDFSFSGLKTAVLRYVRENRIEAVGKGFEPDQQVIDLIASFQDKVIRSLLARLRKAAALHNPRTIILAGGVACNTALRARVNAEDFGAPVYYPSPLLTTDNAAMIAAAGDARLARGENHGLEFTPSASLRIENVVLEGYERTSSARYKV
ncbi:MAG TPA: tRNA (adenosine(37)-N6)-threonylcarbamoyltransferase complex transferase subunit TsaD [Blastocatellia bacterium]|jgi:N6-L-threonylcarbamoyladenine synthase|nr:tRNA (adenosine(37)-N6)-threonylcarbamoyltransferase complex transferase subunit TsaD [Blastocatellia bacterium]